MLRVLQAQSLPQQLTVSAGSMDLTARLQSSQGCSTSYSRHSCGAASCSDGAVPPRMRARRRAEVRQAAAELRRAVTLLASSLPEQASNGKQQPQATSTEFVAETLLPTQFGKYRVRAYRHRVSPSVAVPALPCSMEFTVCGPRTGFHAVVQRDQP